METNASHIDSRKTFYAPLKTCFKIQKRKDDVPTSMQYYHYHNSYELYYLCSGERYYFIKDKTYHIKKGSFVLVNKYDIHSTTNLASLGHERFLIGFTEEFLKPLLEATDAPHLLDCFKSNIRVIELNLQNQHFVESILNTMLHEYKAENTGYHAYLQTAMTQLLLIINRHSNQADNPDSGYINASHKTISQITGYINNNYSDDINLQDLSEKFYISPYYFSRTFKKVSGLSFIEYLNNVRIKEAQKLLLNTNMSIMEVCEAVGYKSNTHFGRVFKKITGMSPLAYKKEHKNS